MRITKEMLQKSARDSVAVRLKSDKDLVAAYLTGSVLGDDPLLGGQADIDLVLVHSNEPQKQREIVKVFDEVHLDITHHPQSMYFQPRELRMDPWLGYSIQSNPLLLYDVRHWFEFTQASVGSQFYRPDHAIGRARKLAENARVIWTDIHQTKMTFAQKVNRYFDSLECAGNAIACLSGSPIGIRRFSLMIEDRFASIGQEDMYSGFIYMTGINDVTEEDVLDMLPDWERAYQVAGQQENCAPELHPLRKDYYLKAMQEILEENNPDSIAMLFLHTWNKSICASLSTTPEYDTWLQTMSKFHLSKDELPDRLTLLDHFIDRLDEALEKWAFENGA